MKIQIKQVRKHLLLLTFIGLSFTLFSQDVKQDFKTSSVSIFKNGTAFFIKSGKIKTDNSAYRMTENIPPALFGTYWIISPSGELDFLSSYIDTLAISKKILANSLVEMLNANLGKKVRLDLGKDQIITGTVEALEEDVQEPGNASTRQIVSFRTDDGKWMTLRNSEIRRIEFAEKPNQRYEQKAKKIKAVLQVDFTTEKENQDLDMMYLSRGLNWTPTYLIELIEEEKARLTLRAEVINNVEDLEHADVNFVVGVPNFSYAGKLSPLVDFPSAGLVYNQTASFPTNFSNTFQTQSISYSIQEDQAFAAPSNADGLQGSAEEDLYFYTMEDVNLKKGGRGQYPIFTADINIAHIYECNLPQNNANKNSYQENYLFSPDLNKVFHSIKVVNDTKYPFTTGPALVVKKQGNTKPISQDRLNYTSINGNSFVKLTEAPDVRIKQAEKAIAKVELAKKVSSGNATFHYDFITVEGKVEVKNYKEKKIDLNIRRTIIGALQKSSIDWLKAERLNTAGDLNKLTDVCWETSVSAGEEITITYSYQIYVPH